MAKRQPNIVKPSIHPKERLIKDIKWHLKKDYVLVECVWCGKDHWISKYNYTKGKNLFCNNTCKFSYKWANDPETKYHNYRNGDRGLEIEKSCEYCEKLFWARNDNLQAGKGRFCSKSCARFFHHLNSEKHIFPGFENGHFYWYAERKDWWYVWKTEEGEFTNMRGSKACWLLHGKEIPDGMYVRNSNPNKFGIDIDDLFLTYDMRPKDSYLRGENHPRYRDGQGNSYPKEYYEIRVFVLYRDDYTCQICGNIQDLHVHHINRNKKDNDINNLITLCQSCHHQIHFKNMEVLYDDIFVFRYLLGEQ